MLKCTSILQGIGPGINQLNLIDAVFYILGQLNNLNFDIYYIKGVDNASLYNFE